MKSTSGCQSIYIMKQKGMVSQAIANGFHAKKLKN